MWLIWNSVLSEHERERRLLLARLPCRTSASVVDRFVFSFACSKLELSLHPLRTPIGLVLTLMSQRNLRPRLPAVLLWVEQTNSLLASLI